MNKQKLLDELRKSGKWIEVSDNQYKPFFQGWLYTVTDDSYGLALGVLLEKDINPALIRDLKKVCKIEYLCDGRIIAKALIDFYSNVIFSNLTDNELKMSLQNLINSEKETDVMLEMDSEGLRFVENPEDESAFLNVWNQASHNKNSCKL